MNIAEHLRNYTPSWKEMRYEAVIYSLEGCEVFKHISEDEIEDAWNGVGPDRFPAWLRYLLSKLNRVVLPACCIHDLRYEIGGSLSDFYRSNDELYRNSIKCIKANRKKFSLLGYWWAKIKAKLAAWLCNNFGYEGWNKK